jgi:beta-aspartyl-peptidase (threonine type)
MSKARFGIAIHGGAGTIIKNQMSDKLEKKYRNALEAAVDKAYKILDKGGSSLDAVEASVIYLENCSLFNSGKGSVFTSKGTHEMDASIMSGIDQNAGAVALVSNIKNPVALARKVMENSDHVFLAGKGAEKFAFQHGFKKMKPEYFFNQKRYDQLIIAQKEKRMILDHADKKYGTVGAVALDKQGNLAAATSTGGMTNKKFGRIGDSPLIGSGTYADNGSCAVSCTGTGEYFIRINAAFLVSSLIRFGNRTIDEATQYVIFKSLTEIGGDGGLIAIDKEAQVAKHLFQFINNFTCPDI